MVALADIALQPADGLVVLADISKRQDVSLPYLEQLFVKLRRAGLVASVRGPGGGYRLAKLEHPRSVWSKFWPQSTKPLMPCIRALAFQADPAAVARNP